MKAEKTRELVKNVLIYILLIFYLTPFLLILLNSFKSTEEFVKNPFALPGKMNIDNYIDAFHKMNFLKSFLNSLIMTSVSTVIIILISSMAAYLFVREKWKINNMIFATMIASMLIPFQTIMIPLVAIYGNLNLLNNKLTLIFMYAGFGTPFATFTFHGFIKGIPIELEEAALIDGCNKIQTFFRIVFPLLKPVITTIVVLDVLWIWNDYLLPSLILLSPEQRTLPLTTYAFFNTYSADFSPLMAGLILTITPVIIIYLLAQNQILRGIVQGAFK